MIETIFFDFGGTLAHEPFPHADSFAAFLSDRGIEATRQEVERGNQAMVAFHDRWDQTHPTDPSKTLADRFWFNACLEFARHISSIPDSHDLAELMHASHQIIPYKLYDDTIPALDALAQRGMKMGVISNWDAPTLEFATRDLGIRRFFTMAISSRCAECEKPRPAIFHEACRRAQARPETSMMVGDSLKADIEGSRALGMTPIWINRTGLDAPEHGLMIRKLNEIPAILDQIGC